MRSSSHLRTLVLLACGCGGSVEHRPDERASLLALVDRVRTNYSQMTTYADDGRVVVPSDRGEAVIVTFKTERRSAEELVFSYRSADGEIEETLEAHAAGARIVGHDGSTNYRSLDDALSASTGVSSFSARITPALLMGRDPCECLTTAPIKVSVLASEPEAIELTYRLRSGALFSLVVNRRTALVQRASFRWDGTQFDVIIDSSTPGTLGHRPLPQETLQG